MSGESSQTNTHTLSHGTVTLLTILPYYHYQPCHRHDLHHKHVGHPITVLETNSQYIEHGNLIRELSVFVHLWGHKL